MTDTFWPFSLAFYDDAATQSACLRLQDDHGADVNIALCLLWHAHRGRALDAGAVRALDAAIAPWRSEVVRPLRALRRKLKADSLGPDAAAQEAFRAQVKKVELSAEKVQQQMLEDLDLPATEGAEPAAAARANLTAYAASLPSPVPDALIDQLIGRLARIGAA